MKTNEFSLLGTELGLTAYGATLCGVVDGWPLTLWNNNVNHVHLIVDRKRDSALVKQINAVLKTWGGDQFLGGKHAGHHRCIKEKGSGQRIDLYSILCICARPCRTSSVGNVSLLRRREL